MARKLFERQAIRKRSGSLANGVNMKLYTDAAGTVLADISATLGGSAIAGSQVTTGDIAGLGPASLRFYGPPDGTDILYIRVPSDSSLGVQKIEADPDPRLDALESGSASGIPGTIFDAKGDIIAATAADTVARLAVGADGKLLSAAAGDTTGLRWLAPPVINAQAAPYNATGDGTTADHVAIQAAINAAEPAGAGVSGGGTVFLPKGTYIINAQLVVKNGVRLVGVSERATVIKAGGSFPTSTPLIRLGDGTGICFGTQVRDLQIRCESIAGSTGVYSNEAQEQSGVFNCIIIEFRAYGIQYANGTSIVGIDQVDMYSASAGATAGILFDGSSGQNFCRSVSVGGYPAGTDLTDGVRAINTDVTIEGIHGERCTDLVHISGSSGLVRGLYGHGSVANVLHTDCFAIAVIGVWGNGATNLIVDDHTGLTVAGAVLIVPFYVPQDAVVGDDLRVGGSLSVTGAFLSSTNSIFIDSGSVVFGGSQDVTIGRAAADVLATNDDFRIGLVGKGLQVAEGSNAKMGLSTLVAGSVVVSTTAVTANSRIFLTSQAGGGTPGFLRVSARTAGTSFTITSSNAADTSTVAWHLIEPA